MFCIRTRIHVKGYAVLSGYGWDGEYRGKAFRGLYGLLYLRKGGGVRLFEGRFLEEVPNGDEERTRRERVELGLRY